eukprot:Ihof_evm7s100 gene=Ihof_evmTU7s100
MFDMLFGPKSGGRCKNGLEPTASAKGHRNLNNEKWVTSVQIGEQPFNLEWNLGSGDITVNTDCTNEAALLFSRYSMDSKQDLYRGLSPLYYGGKTFPNNEQQGEEWPRQDIGKNPTLVEGQEPISKALELNDIPLYNTAGFLDRNPPLETSVTCAEGGWDPVTEHNGQRSSKSPDTDTSRLMERSTSSRASILTENTRTSRGGQNIGFNYELKPACNCELKLQIWWMPDDMTLNILIHEAKAFVPIPSSQLPPPPDSMPQNIDLSSDSSIFSFMEEVDDLNPQVFWVEASWRTGQITEPNSLKTCQFICERGEKMTKDDVEGTSYEASWEEELVFQIDPSLVQSATLNAQPVINNSFGSLPLIHSLASMVNGHHTTNAMAGQDNVIGAARPSTEDKEQFHGNVRHLVLVLFKGLEPLGELSLPLKTMLNAQSEAQWYDMSSVDKTFATRMKRLEGIPGRRNLRFYDETEQDDSLDLRKILSIRAIFICIILCQMTLVILVITVILYQSAITELTKSAEISSHEVLSNIMVQVDNLMTAIMVGVLTTSSLREEPFDSYNSIVHVFMENYNQSMSQQIYTADELFIGLQNGVYIGVGLNDFYFAPKDTGPDHVPLVFLPENAGRDKKTSPFDPSETRDTPYTLVAYGLNAGCTVGNLSCDLIDYSTVHGTVPDFVVKERQWYDIAITSEVVSWTPVYSPDHHFSLSLTSVYGVPRDTSEPLRFIVGLDISLNVLSDTLESLTYYKRGYGFLYEADTNLIIANSINASLTKPDGQRLLISESDDAGLAHIGSLLMQVNLTGIQPATQLKNTSINHVFYIDKKLVSVGKYRNVGIDWIVVVVIPNEDFITYFNNMLIVSVAVSTTQMAIGILVALYVIDRIVGQLVRCTKQLCYFSALDFSIPVPSRGIHHPIKEIARIYQALRSIRLSLTSFAKYVPPDVVRILVGAGLEAALGGQKKELTIFFSQIVHFTTMAETLGLHQLMQMLSEYLEGMLDIVQANEGTVDKFVGDKVMGLWNAPENVINHPLKACEAALLCQFHLTAMSEKWHQLGFPDIKMHIGIHTGQAIVGNLGSRDRLNYTALGDSVNLASRLEGLNKMYGTEIIISEDTFHVVQPHVVCRPLDKVVVKGKAKPIVVYELIAHTEAAVDVQ